MTKPVKTNPFNIAVFDIETTSLEGSFGRLLCACFKFSHEASVRSVKCRQLRSEQRALREFVSHWNDADIVVGWNSKRFDQRFINARLLHYGMPTLASKMHIDLMWLWRHYVRSRGSSLDGTIKDLQIDTRKFDVEAHHWVEAAQEGTNSVESFEKILKHCEHDVIATEQVLCKIKPMVQRITK